MGGTGEPAGRGAITRVGNVVFGADRVFAAWVAQRVPGYIPTANSRALGVLKGDRAVAGVVFENYNGVHIEAAIAAEPGVAWADRRTLHAFFYYPFVTLGVEAISVSVPMSNLPSLNLATKLGFEPEAIIALAAHDGSGLVVMKQFRDRCRWVQDDGQKRRQRSDAP